MAMVRKYIDLRLRGDAYEILQRARATIARADQEDREQRAMKMWALKALYACREAFSREQKLNRFMSESGREQTRKRYKLIEAELRRIAGD